MQTNHSVSFDRQAMETRALLDRITAMLPQGAANRPGQASNHRMETLEVVHAEELDAQSLRDELTNQDPALGATNKGREILGQLGVESGPPSDGDILRMLTVREVINKTRNDPAYTSNGLRQDLSAAGIGCH